MSELLPCPFCGGEHDGSKIAHIDTCFIVMEELNAFDYEDGRTPRYNEEQLREAWNTRAERTCEGCKHAAQNRHKDPCYACDRNTAARGDDYYEVVSE